MVKRVLVWSCSFLFLRGTFFDKRLRAWSLPWPDTFLLATISSKAIRIAFRSLLASIVDNCNSIKLVQYPFLPSMTYQGEKKHVQRDTSFLTKHKSFLFSIFPSVFSRQGVIHTLEQIGSCQGNLLIVHCHNTAKLLNTNEVGDRHCLTTYDQNT